PATRAQLRDLTQQVRQNDGFGGAGLLASVGNHQHVVPVLPGGSSPIKHVIVMVNENRTYDQVLGDLDKGNGDPALILFGEDVTPVSVYNAPTLAAHTDPLYAGFNMAISDQTRFAEWKREFDRYVANKSLPSLEFIKFPRDHTCGTSPSCPTPQAMVADSDYA